MKYSQQVLDMLRQAVSGHEAAHEKRNPRLAVPSCRCRR